MRYKKGRYIVFVFLVVCLMCACGSESRRVFSDETINDRKTNHLKNNLSEAPESEDTEERNRENQESVSSVLEGRWFVFHHEKQSGGKALEITVDQKAITDPEMMQEFSYE